MSRAGLLKYLAKFLFIRGLVTKEKVNDGMEFTLLPNEKMQRKIRFIKIGNSRLPTQSVYSRLRWRNFSSEFHGVNLNCF